MVTNECELAVSVVVKNFPIETTSLMILGTMKRVWFEYCPIDEANAIGCGLHVKAGLSLTPCCSTLGLTAAGRVHVSSKWVAHHGPVISRRQICLPRLIETRGIDFPAFGRMGWYNVVSRIADIYIHFYNPITNCCERGWGVLCD